MAHSMGCIIPIWPQESASASAGPLLPVPGQSAVVGRAALLAVADQAAPQPGLVAVLLVLTRAPSLCLQDLGDLGHHIWGDVNTLLDAIINLKLPKLHMVIVSRYVIYLRLQLCQEAWNLLVSYNILYLGMNIIIWNLFKKLFCLHMKRENCKETN